MALDELEKLVWEVLMELLGYDPKKTYAKPPVRRSWGKMGQPGWSYDEDVLFFQLSFIDGQDVSQPLHDFWKDEIKHDEPTGDLIRHQEQTRVMEARLVAYGPNGVTNLDNIRTAIYNGVPALRSAGIFVVPGNEAPKYAPELFQSQWWRRADMRMIFNVAKSYDTKVKTIVSVPISLRANEPMASTTVKTRNFTVNKEE